MLANFSLNFFDEQIRIDFAGVDEAPGLSVQIVLPWGDRNNFGRFSVGGDKDLHDGKA